MRSNIAKIVPVTAVSLNISSSNSLSVILSNFPITNYTSSCTSFSSKCDPILCKFITPLLRLQFAKIHSKLFSATVHFSMLNLSSVFFGVGEVRMNLPITNKKFLILLFFYTSRHFDGRFFNSLLFSYYIQYFFLFLVQNIRHIKPYTQPLSFSKEYIFSVP